MSTPGVALTTNTVVANSASECVPSIGARPAQSSSTAIAVASPPPMHSAAMPRFLPRLLQRAEQRDDDARAAGADRVAERDRRRRGR